MGLSYAMGVVPKGKKAVGETLPTTFSYILTLATISVYVCVCVCNLKGRAFTWMHLVGDPFFGSLFGSLVGSFVGLFFQASRSGS